MIKSYSQLWEDIKFRCNELGLPPVEISFQGYVGVNIIFSSGEFFQVRGPIENCGRLLDQIILWLDGYEAAVNAKK